MRESDRRDSGRRSSRVLAVIAVERSLRAVILVIVGAVLVSHLHTDWGRTVSDVARALNFNPDRGAVARAAGRAHAVTPGRVELYGVVALGYGLLEGTEAYGLWRRRIWGEYLTIVATALLLIPEGIELARSATALKVVGTVVNVAIVIYLIVRVRRRRPGRA